MKKVIAKKLIDVATVREVLAVKIRRAQAELASPLFPDMNSIWKNKLFSYLEVWEALWPDYPATDYLQDHPDTVL